MKQTQEFAGKDIDSAVKNACFELNLSKSELKYDIISTGASGIFGIVGRKNAKIRVAISDSNSATHQDDDGVQSIVDEAFGVKPKKSKPEQSNKKTDLPKKPTNSKTAKKRQEDKPAKKQPDSRQSEKKQSTKRADEQPVDNQPDQQPDQQQPPAKPEAEKKPDKEQLNNKRKERGEQEIVDVTKESIDLGLEAIQKMIDLITDDATVSYETDRDKLLLKVNGGNSGILIGRKGQTLEAMQFLTDKIVNRQSDARVRVKVDIEGYMEARKTNLIQLAHKMADKAKKTGRPATINQMSGQDRRIIHLTLKEDPRVRTQSKGDGYYRRLIILPKRTSSFKEKSKHNQKENDK